MKDWVEKPLGDFCEIKHGFAFKGERFTNQPTEYYVVTPANFAIGGGFQGGKDTFYVGDFPDEYILEKDDLIVTMTDLSKTGDTLGFPALVPANQKYEYLHNQRIGKVIVNENEVNKLFIYWLMRTQAYQRYIVGLATGSTVKHTAPKSIKSFKSNFPSLPIQTRIADILSTYDEAIENNNRRIALLEKIAQELYREWFVRFRFPGHESVKVVNGLPDGWEVVRLKSFGQIETGKTPPTENKDNYGDEIMFVKTPDMHSNMYVITTGEYLSEKGHLTQPKKLLPANSIMVSCIGTGGVVALNAEQAHTNQQINSIIPDNERYTEWLFFTCQNLKEIIELFGATGATMPNLSKGKFERLKVIQPPQFLIEMFHERTKDSFSLIKTLMRQSQNLVQQRDLLLPRLMSGKLEVQNA